jgi:zinc ribbon protein
MWMCAATALPVSPENLRRQVIVPVAPSFPTVAVKVPPARLTLPFGFGRSWRLLRLVVTEAVVASWPRISPAPFVGVCTFTYALPLWIASSAASVRFPVPLNGLWHGPHSARTTGPGVPVAPVWMCAATAFPVSPLNESSHAIVAPVSDFVTVAVNVPRPDAVSPVGVGTSWPAFITVLSWIDEAVGLADAPSVTTSATTSAIPEMSAVGLKTSSLLAFAPFGVVRASPVVGFPPAEIGYHLGVNAEARPCPACGSDVSADARFCPQCGRSLASEEARPNLYGVLAPGPALVLSGVLFLAGVLALIAGSIVGAIVFLAFASGAFVLFYDAARRNPESPLAQRFTTTSQHLRGWLRFARESIAAWADAIPTVLRLRRESRSLSRERDEAIRSLGDAAYREDDAAVTTLRERVREIDRELAEREQEREAALAHARRHVEEEHAAATTTQKFTVDEITSGGDADSS